jgi:hypothetical protein
VSLPAHGLPEVDPELGMLASERSVRPAVAQGQR